MELHDQPPAIVKIVAVIVRIVLRAIGKPAFVTSPDVIAALIREGVLERAPGGKRDLLTIQNTFNEWSEQSGRDLTEISRILAMSVESGGHDRAGQR